MSDPISRLNAALEGRYRIERELGEGGMAIVYLAEDLRHERKVALKVLRPELAAVVGADRFLAEIKTTANLQHPHILPLHDSGDADGFLFYVMPYVEGESLRGRLDREHQLAVDAAVAIATNMAEALDYAHRQGVIHRDIKPANVLMLDGKPMIADFGIALAIGAAGRGRLTETGLSLGTPHYMSPEQATGDQHLGPQTDIYALGCVLYEMLIGEPPYTGSSAQVVLGKIISGAAESVIDQRPSVPANVDATISRSLERLPADRFGTAGEFATALGDDSFRYGAAATVGRGRPTGAAWKYATIALAVLSGGLGLALAARPSPSEDALIARFTVEVRHQGLVRGQDLGVDISEDGSTIAFGVMEALRGSFGGFPQTEIWVRRLDNPAARRMEETRGASHPAFSPTGSQLAFEIGGELRTMPAAGGVSTLVAQVGRIAGLDWGPNGTLFFGDQAGSISRVSAAAGAPESLTTVDPGVRHAFPAVLPTGGLLLTLIRGPPEESWIGAVGPDGGVPRDVVQGTMARYARSGHVVYSTADGSLFAAPFDLDRLELTGPPLGLAEDVAVYGGSASEFAISESGTLVYATRPLEAAQAMPVWVNRQGAVRPVDEGFLVAGHPNLASIKLSPDADRIAVTIEEGGRFDLWIKQLPAGPATRLTDQGAANHRASWTPDGESLVFVSSRLGHRDLWRRRADGADTAQMVLDGEGEVWEALYSPDGEWLIYRDRRGGNDDIYGRPAAGEGAEVPLLDSEFMERSPALSPDGRWLAYVSNESGRYEVYVRPFPETRSARWQVSTDFGTEPLWSHSGRELFYRNAENELISVAVVGEPEFELGQRTVLFKVEDWVQTPAGRPLYDVLPDGSFVLLQAVGSDAGQDLNVWLNFAEDLRRRVPD